MAERARQQDHASVAMNPFFRGADLHDTSPHTIREMVAKAGSTRALFIDIDQGAWWSTRLYLLATLLQSLTGVRQLVFTHSRGKFAGMASPAAVREGLCATFSEIARFDTALRGGRGSQDTEREIARCIKLWNAQMDGADFMLNADVRWPLVTEWLGERLITRCITIDADAGLTTIQAQKIIESLIPDVPVEQRTRPPTEGPEDTCGPELMVVDRDAFALEVAREWVRNGLPRER
jgi:hypothetical protein